VFVGEKGTSQQALIQKNLLKIKNGVNNPKRGETGENRENRKKGEKQ